jgi:hypothetical protein
MAAALAEEPQQYWLDLHAPAGFSQALITS